MSLVSLIKSETIARLHRADRAARHRPRAAGGARGGFASRWLPGDRLWRRPAATR